MSYRTFQFGSHSELRRGRVSEDFGCYAITKVVNDRRSLLASGQVAQILVDSWDYLRQSDRIKLFAFCIMPDHYHLTLCLMPGDTLAKVMESTNKFTARLINRHLGDSGVFWQEGFHDHNCQTVKEVYDLSSYIEHNPVRAGIVEAAED